jgi:hypothetical protein
MQEVKDELLKDEIDLTALEFEIADLLNMIEQIVIIKNLSDTSINNRQNRKMQRELKRIESNE